MHLTAKKLPDFAVCIFIRYRKTKSINIIETKVDLSPNFKGVRLLTFEWFSTESWYCWNIEKYNIKCRSRFAAHDEKTCSITENLFTRVEIE